MRNPEVFENLKPLRRKLLTLGSGAAIGAIVSQLNSAPAQAAYQSNALLTFENINVLLNSYIPSIVKMIRLIGYNAYNDGGGADYYETTDAIGPGVVQSLGGRRWKIGSLVYNPLMFGAQRDQAAVDSYQAFKDCLDTIKAQSSSFDFRYGGPLYVPNGQYELSNYLLINAPGIRLIGDGSATSVIKAQSGFNAEAVIWHTPQSTTSTQVGAGLIGIGIDCNEQLCRGYLGESVYDDVVYDDVRISRPHADWVGFNLRPEASNTIQICQTIDIRSLFVAKYTQKGTVPAIYLNSCQEVNVYSSKGWNGFGTDANRGTQAPWFLQDCQTVNMYGCSYASSQRAGLVVYAATRDVNQISLYSPVFENLTGVVETVVEPGFSVVNLQVLNPRHESPVTGGYDLKSVVRGTIECNQKAVSLDANCNVTIVQVDQATQVTNAGVNTTIEARA